MGSRGPHPAPAPDAIPDGSLAQGYFPSPASRADSRLQQRTRRGEAPTQTAESHPGKLRSGRRSRFPAGCQTLACKPPDLVVSKRRALPSKPCPGSTPGNTQSWGTGGQHLPPQRMLRKVAVLIISAPAPLLVSEFFKGGEIPCQLPTMLPRSPPPPYFTTVGEQLPKLLKEPRGAADAQESPA